MRPKINKNAPSVWLGRRLLVPLWVGGESQKIIDGNMVEFTQFDQNICRNIPLPKLVVAVNPLGAVKILRYLTLFQIVIFPQIPDSLI